MFSYLSEFLSRSLSAYDKLKILINHYAVLQEVFSAGQLNAIFNGGLECYREIYNENLFSISLFHKPGYEVEGPFSFLYTINGKPYFKLAFMIAPGDIFGLEQRNVFYISCIQKNYTKVEGIPKAAPVHNIHPVIMLLNALKAFGNINGINNCIAISAKNQLSYIKENDGYDYFFSLYDDFWLSKGGIPLKDDYLLTFPFIQKPILEIKQTHRNRVRRKRARLQEIYDEVYRRLSYYSKDPNTNPPSIA